MIGHLSGRILECTPGQVLLDVAGVGYEVHIPLSTYYALTRQAPGQASLHVHTHVRDDALLLYGFVERGEREIFERLITISGVGPRMALAILSGIGPDELVLTVRQADRTRLERIPGVGKKTAQRLLLELKDKLGIEGTAPAPGEAPAHGAPLDPASGIGLRADAVSALLNLGYAADRAERAVDRSLAALDPDPPLERVLRGALGLMMGG